MTDTKEPRTADFIMKFFARPIANGKNFEMAMNAAVKVLNEGKTKIVLEIIYTPEPEAIRRAQEQARLDAIKECATYLDENGWAYGDDLRSALLEKK